MRLLLATLIAATAGSAFADTCYRRTYSETHLQKNPAQTVRMIEVRFTDGADNRQAFARVIFRDGPKLWTNGLYCWREDSGVQRCGVECDGGTFTVKAKDERSIYLTTKGGFNVGGSCGDGVEIDVRPVTDEGAAKTVYRLDEVNPASCQ